ncbi:MAG TPA: phosphate transport system regulatory protein PhoU, partial [Synergistaceae bacterium]|nr:phosphate transport system regulatory protein PhoU [Synergistaceae bacterium]
MVETLSGRKAFDEELQKLEQNLMKLGTLAEDAI